jgi:hypothetical protein
MKFVFIVIALTLSIGCQSKAHKKPKSNEGQFITATPEGSWKKVEPGGADKAWYHPDIGASIYFDSNCKERFEDGRLEDLITHLTFGLVQGAPLREEMLMLDGREALLRVYDGKMDGVPVRVGAVVTKKNECLYDGVYIASPSEFDAQWSAFVEVISGFKTKGK